MATVLNRAQLGQLGLSVRDMAVSLPFYRDVLGLPLLFMGGPTLAFLDCGGVRVMLDANAGAGRGGHDVVLYFRVDDLEAAFARLEPHAPKIEEAPHLVARMPDHELWMAFFRDPDGHLLALMAEKRG